MEILLHSEQLSLSYYAVSHYKTGSFHIEKETKTFRSGLGHGIELPGIIKVQMIISTGKWWPWAVSLTLRFLFFFFYNFKIIHKCMSWSLWSSWPCLWALVPPATGRTVIWGQYLIEGFRKDNIGMYHLTLGEFIQKHRNIHTEETVAWAVT